MTEATSAKSHTREDGAILHSLAFRPTRDSEVAFDRADLIIEGIPHESTSYEVRLFFNNPEANADSARSAETGYAGKFSVFGHGGCMGESGHCAVAGAPTGTDAAALAIAMPHPLSPKRKVVRVTEALGRILAQEGALEGVTFVPIRMAPRRQDCGPASGLFSYTSVTLRTYR